jgi:hypothetical protein
LPPNLSADDPSLSFTFKGFDVNMAAYMSELAYLAHPVSTHGQIAEMGNQSVNSLALLTARYALEAVEVLSLMAATFIYTLCQALNLHCLHFEFVKQAEPAIHRIVSQVFYPIVVADKEAMKILGSKAWEALLEKWVKLSHGRGDGCSLEIVAMVDAVARHIDQRVVGRRIDFKSDAAPEGDPRAGAQSIEVQFVAHTDPEPTLASQDLCRETAEI